jgi:hypothetical protein
VKSSGPEKYSSVASRGAQFGGSGHIHPYKGRGSVSAPPHKFDLLLGFWRGWTCPREPLLMALPGDSQTALALVLPELH